MSNDLVDTWRKAISRVKRKTEGQALILMYHRIMVGDRLDDEITVSPTHFREHLEVLRRYDVISLDQLVHDMKRDSLPHNAVAITFDDGYATSLHNAKPLLDMLDAPATAFVISGAVKDGATFWWEKLERILLDSKVLPRRLNLGNGKSLELKGNGTKSSERTQLDGMQGGECEEKVLSHDERHNLYRRLVLQMLQMSEHERNRIIDSLASATGVEPALTGLRCSLSEEELALLAQDPMITIGAHTITHAYLPGLPIEEQRAEIESSKAFLEDVLGRKITGFSYPYGGYTQETLALVHEAGFTYACTVDPKVVRRGFSPIELPRMTVEDWDGEGFARRIQGWFNGEE